MGKKFTLNVIIDLWLRNDFTLINFKSLTQKIDKN